MRLKRIAAMLMTAVMAVSLAACGGNADTNTESSQNPQESTELMRFIRHIRDEFDLTILLIEHDMKVVMGVCQYIWVLEYGQLIAEGDPDAIRNNPRVIEAYLGEDVSNHA